jgi:hypothetical protein
MTISLTHLNVFTTKPAQEGPAVNIPSEQSKWVGRSSVAAIPCLE